MYRFLVSSIFGAIFAIILFAPSKSMAMETQSNINTYIYAKNIRIESGTRKSICAKFLRIVKEIRQKSKAGAGGWITSNGLQTPAVGYYSSTRLLPIGIVVLDATGSAVFGICADDVIRIQILDENLDMFSESASFELKSKKIYCLEGSLHNKPIEIAKNAIENIVISAVKHYPASQVKNFSYMRDIQPIFDKYCLECHDYESAGGGKILLCGHRGIVFNRSYTELFFKDYVKVYKTSTNTNGDLGGARNSILVSMIRDGHGDSNLSATEFEMLRLWIDMGAPFYASDAGAFTENPSGRSPLNSAKIKEINAASKTGAIGGDEISSMINLNNYPLELISFDRPYESEILINLDKKSPEYTSILEIIKNAAARLKNKKRIDF